MSPPPAGEPPSLQDSLRRLLVESAAVGHGRLELVLLEFGDERERLGRLLARAAALAIAVIVASQLAVLLAVALVWDSGWRLEAMALLLGGALLLVGLAVQRLRALPASTLFELSRRELARDRAGVEHR